MVQAIGRKVEVPNQVIINLGGQQYQFPKYISALQTTAKINPVDYALVQDKPLVPQEGSAEFQAESAVSMAQMFNGKGNFWGLNEMVFAEGLKGMDARKFLPHLFQVNESLAGRGVLYDANGNLIEGEKLTSYTQRLNHNTWAYLNAHFQPTQEQGFRGLDLLTITNYESGKPVFSRVPLETCLEQDCWADVTPESLNSQGFPTKKSPIGDKYEPGKTAIFRYPRNGAVARFISNSVRANLGCFWNPDGRYDSLGVTVSAEGAKPTQK